MSCDSAATRKSVAHRGSTENDALFGRNGMKDPTGHEDRRDRRNLFAIGVVIAFALAIVVIAGPTLMSTFFPGDGTGSPGNPTHTRPVEPRTK
jgi:hypothetical protein